MPASTLDKPDPLDDYFDRINGQIDALNRLVDGLTSLSCFEGLRVRCQLLLDDMRPFLSGVVEQLDFLASRDKGRVLTAQERTGLDAMLDKNSEFIEKVRYDWYQMSEFPDDYPPVSSERGSRKRR